MVQLLRGEGLSESKSGILHLLRKYKTIDTIVRKWATDKEHCSCAFLSGAPDGSRQQQFSCYIFLLSVLVAVVCL
jgi:hypothetical protein